MIKNRNYTRHHDTTATKRPLRRLARALGHLSLLLASMLFASCGLVDMGLEEARNELAATMELDRDTLYVMQGDHFMLNPIFTPDSISNQSIYYFSDDESVVRMDNDSLWAVGQGWTTVRAISVTSRLTDSCAVCVLEPWTPVSPYAYPNETIVYAEASVDGEPVLPAADGSVMLAALIGGEVRALGQRIEAFGRTLICFRIAGEMTYEEDDSPSTVSFAYYHRPSMRYILFPQYVKFDGETHGTPSKPFLLEASE